MTVRLAVVEVGFPQFCPHRFPWDDYYGVCCLKSIDCPARLEFPEDCPLGTGDEKYKISFDGW